MNNNHTATCAPKLQMFLKKSVKSTCERLYTVCFHQNSFVPILGRERRRVPTAAAAAHKCLLGV